MTDIKIPKSWKELESENAQLREDMAVAKRILEELDNDTDGVELDSRGVGFVSVDIDNQIIEDAREFLASHPADTKEGTK